MTLDLRAALAGLHRNLQRVAVDGVVPAGAFEAEVAHLGLDPAARSRLAAELERMGLRTEAPPRPVRTAAPSPPAAASPAAAASAPASTGILLDLVARYAEAGAVTEDVVAGVARLAGLGAAGTAALRTGAAARFTLVAAHPAAEATAASGDAGPASGDAGPPSGDAATTEPGPPEPASDGPAISADGLDAAVAAALRVLDEDRYTRRPAKAVLAADAEVGLSVLLRGGVDLVGVEPTAEELAALPPDDVRRRARDCLIAHNQGLVHSLARKHLEQGLEYEDLFQHGVVGLLNAVRKYDALQGNKLSTYATWWIRQAMSRAVADEGSIIRVPVHMHEAMQKVARAERQLISSGHHPSLADVAVACDLPLDKVRQVRRISKVTDSLDRVIGDGTSLGELVEGRTAIPSVEGTVLQHLADEDVHRFVGLLPERYAFIVDRRVGLNGHEPATLDVIGAELKVTRERVRQLESHALPVLRLALEAPGGEPYTALRAMLTDPRVGSNPVGAISRDLKGAKWGAGVVALRAFRARTGHTYPAPDHHEDGFPLGVWMTEQRALAGADGTGLPLHRKIVLGLAGVRWHPVAAAEPPAPRRPRLIRGLVRPRTAVPAQRSTAPAPPATAPHPPVPPARAAEPETAAPAVEVESLGPAAETETVAPGTEVESLEPAAETETVAPGTEAESLERVAEAEAAAPVETVAEAETVAPGAEPGTLEPVAEAETAAPAAEAMTLEQAAEAEAAAPGETVAPVETADAVAEEPELPAAREELAAAEEAEASQFAEEPRELVAGRPTEERLREAEEALRALESEVVHRVAVARADERNKARAAVEAEVDRRTAETLEAADRLLEEAQEDAEKQLRTALESAGTRARAEADARLRAALQEAEARLHAPLEAAEARAREAQEEIVRLHEAVSRTAKRYEDRLREGGASARTTELEEELRQARAEVQRLTADARRESDGAERRIAELGEALHRAQAEIQLLTADGPQDGGTERRIAELEGALHRSRAEVQRLTLEARQESGAAERRIAELDGALRLARADAAREGDAAERRTAELGEALHRAQAEIQRLTTDGPQDGGTERRIAALEGALHQSRAEVQRLTADGRQETGTAELEQALQQARSEVQRLTLDARRESGAAERRIAELDGALRLARAEVQQLTADGRQETGTAELEQALQQARAEVQRLTLDARQESGAAERRIAELDGALRLARADAARESAAAERRTAELGEALHRAQAEIERLGAEGPRDGGAGERRIAELEGARAEAERERGVAARRVAELEGGLHRARAEAREAEDAAAERMRAVEAWAERVVAEARARVTEVEARLDAALHTPVPPAPPAGPDPRKWWQR
ncbi:sigma-70 family RNA polymerase sigma factor [Streptomyces hydrogenans]|uniref:sigma-70 family RNA polymerase sigma factor n=1 Tax=Streptomyces hydrogenans TaxID=1873719 RepID=UPI0033A666FC